MVKKNLADKNIIYEYVDIDTDEGMEKARRASVRGVPTIVNGNALAVGLEPCKKLIGGL
jgi:glutaredoxin